MREAKFFGGLSEDWHDFFCSDFGIRFPFYQVKIPDILLPFRRVLFDPGSELLPYDHLLLAARRVFKVNFESGMAAFNATFDGVQAGFTRPYAMLCEGEAESGKLTRKTTESTAEEIRRKRISTLDLRQMIIYHMKWYREKGSHLDQTFKTRCSWTRFGKDQVATIRFAQDTLVIGMNYFNDSFPISQDRLAIF